MWHSAYLLTLLMATSSMNSLLSVAFPQPGVLSEGTPLYLGDTPHCSRYRYYHVLQLVMDLGDL